MNVKKYIHPRNKYKKPPDYKKLAIMYPEFRKIVITDLTGKVKIDFKKKESLYVLTETLLKHDFDLQVNIPPDNLNPAITLRMNYILWMEDLMKHLKLKMDEVTGIDIGTGAICIYALLLAKIYGCRMIGTDIDKKTVDYAVKCVRRNNLQDLIKVITVNSNMIFKEAVEENKFYDFSMCNPPFFESEVDNEKVTKVLPPRNAPTGNENELKTKGGEVAFVTKMIEESIELGDRIKVYSTMIGRKANLFHLKKMVKSKNIDNVTWTKFCQGHTTRWGLAWSILPKNVVNLTDAPVIRKNGKSSRKDNKSLIVFHVENKFSYMNDLINFLRATMEELNIKLQDIMVAEDNFDGWVCRITANERTWEHARRKRRLVQRQIALKKSKNENNVSIEVNAENTPSIVSVADEINDIRQANNSSNELSIKKEENGELSKGEVSDKCIPLLVCKLWIESESSEVDESLMRNNIFKICMFFENGSGSLDALHSLRQYLINRLELREKILHDSSKSIEKRRMMKKDFN